MSRRQGLTRSWRAIAVGVIFIAAAAWLTTYLTLLISPQTSARKVTVPTRQKPSPQKRRELPSFQLPPTPAPLAADPASIARSLPGGSPALEAWVARALQSPVDWPTDAAAVAKVRSLLRECDFAQVIAFAKSWSRLPVAAPVFHVAVECAERELDVAPDATGILRELRAMRPVLLEAHAWETLVINCALDERHSPAW
jgi:hypothetical protein